MKGGGGNCDRNEEEDEFCFISFIIECLRLIIIEII